MDPQSGPTSNSKQRALMQTLPVEEWIKGFKEINLGYGEEEAVAEAARCINCGVCSECMQCAIACQAKAVAHDLGPKNLDLDVGAVVLAPGFTGLRSHQICGVPLCQMPQRGHPPGVRADPLRLRALCRPPDAARRPQGAQEDRLAAMRGLPGPATTATTAIAPRSAACTPSSRR